MIKRKFGLKVLTTCILLALMITSCKNSTENNEDKVIPFPVEYEASLRLEYGKPLTLHISKASQIKDLSIYINDSLIKQIPSPNQGSEISLDINYLGIGLKDLMLKAVDQQGNEFQDNQIIKVVSDVIPQSLTARIVTTYPHDPSHFTQGLEIVDGLVYEGTGDPDHKGATKVMEKELTTGKVLKETDLDGNYFGEGITILNNLLYQITWTSQKCFIYSFPSLEKTANILTYNGEGWGLTNDGKNIIMSDGSERIYFRDPNTFSIKRIIEVYDNEGAIKQLNELEYVNGIIYANVWMTDKIVAIDARTGKVIQTINCSAVITKDKGNGDVLNGIAFDHATKKFYITGKYWPSLSQVVFE